MTAGMVLRWLRAVRDAVRVCDGPRPSTCHVVAVAASRVLYADADGRSCSPAQSTVARDAGVERAAVRDVDKWLIAGGWMVQTRTLAHGRREYRLTIPAGSEGVHLDDGLDGGVGVLLSEQGDADSPSGREQPPLPPEPADSSGRTFLPETDGGQMAGQMDAVPPTTSEPPKTGLGFDARSWEGPTDPADPRGWCHVCERPRTHCEGHDGAELVGAVRAAAGLPSRGRDRKDADGDAAGAVTRSGGERVALPAETVDVGGRL